jgi:hypothetical protein
VLDPFAGSGSSRVACANLKLDLVWKGADIDPAYAEVITVTTRPPGFREPSGPDEAPPWAED